MDIHIDLTYRHGRYQQKCISDIISMTHKYPNHMCIKRGLYPSQRAWFNVGSMLGQRRRRWAKIETRLGVCFKFTESADLFQPSKHGDVIHTGLMLGQRAVVDVGPTVNTKPALVDCLLQFHLLFRNLYCICKASPCMDEYKCYKQHPSFVCVHTLAT